jgi:Protein of unknown function (DUF3047)
MKQPLTSNQRLPWASIVIIIIAICAWATLLWGAEFGGFTIAENFERYGEGKFPDLWHSKGSAARTIYRIESENGNRFLRAHADKQAAHIGLEHSFDPKLQKQLQWRWRVHALPYGADERDPEKHDAAAQVYLIFDNRYWPRVIKYIWSTALPSGTRFTNPLYSRGRIVVLRSGVHEKDKWYDETVNLYEDYKSLFGSEPGRVQGIGILSSSDATKTLVIADYDDFVLLP